MKKLLVTLVVIVVVIVVAVIFMTKYATAPDQTSASPTPTATPAKY